MFFNLPEQHISIINSINQVLQEYQIIMRSRTEEKVNEWNMPTMDYPNETVLHEMFVESVKKNPYNIAMCYENKYYTFQEVNTKEKWGGGKKRREDQVNHLCTL